MNQNLFGETSVVAFVDKVFSCPPKEPCTYLIGTLQTTNKLQMLMNILILGARKMYGNDIEPSKITIKQLDHLQSYFKSFGYRIKYIYDDPLQPKKVNIWFEDYKPLVTCSGIKLY